MLYIPVHCPSISHIPSKTPTPRNASLRETGDDPLLSRDAKIRPFLAILGVSLTIFAALLDSLLQPGPRLVGRRSGRRRSVVRRVVFHE